MTCECTWVETHTPPLMICLPTTDDMSATHATVRQWTSRVEGLGHKIFMDNFFSFPRLFDDLDRHKINSCGTVWTKRKYMPLTLDQNK